jgi:hypothetical protein
MQRTQRIQQFKDFERRHSNLSTVQLREIRHGLLKIKHRAIILSIEMDACLREIWKNGDLKYETDRFLYNKDGFLTECEIKVGDKKVFFFVRKRQKGELKRQVRFTVDSSEPTEKYFEKEYAEEDLEIEHSTQAVFLKSFASVLKPTQSVKELLFRQRDNSPKRKRSEVADGPSDEHIKSVLDGEKEIYIPDVNSACGLSVTTIGYPENKSEFLVGTLTKDHYMMLHWYRILSTKPNLRDCTQTRRLARLLFPAWSLPPPAQSKPDIRWLSENFPELKFTEAPVWRPTLSSKKMITVVLYPFHVNIK